MNTVKKETYKGFNKALAAFMAADGPARLLYDPARGTCFARTYPDRGGAGPGTEVLVSKQLDGGAAAGFPPQHCIDGEEGLPVRRVRVKGNCIIAGNNGSKVEVLTGKVCDCAREGDEEEPDEELEEFDAERAGATVLDIGGARVAVPDYMLETVEEEETI